MNWDQLKTLLWLRWRLSRNQFIRSGTLNTVLASIGLAISLVLCVSAGVGGFLGGFFGLSQASPKTTLIVWDIVIVCFLFIWMIEVLAELQRSESLDLARLLHLPISLHGAFVMNYLASHVTPWLLISFPGMIGLALGLICAKGFAAILLLPLLFSFLFLVTSWTYFARGWLVTVMVNPRRRRNVLVAITMLIILLSQAPNIYWIGFRPSQKKAGQSAATTTTTNTPAITRIDSAPFNKLPPAYVSAHNYVPLLWLPNGAAALRAGNPWPALFGTIGAVFLGIIGLALSYRSTLRFYKGNIKAQPVKAPPASAIAPGSIRKNFLEKEVPLLPPEVAALFLAFFRSLTRAPEIKMALVTNALLLVVLSAMTLSRLIKSQSSTANLFLASATIAFMFFSLVQPLCNQFGYDREGFRALLLLPTSRQNILLAKNLSFGLIILTLGFIVLFLLAIVAHLPFLTLLAGCFQLVAVLAIMSIVGNFFSIIAPYRIAAGSMKAAKPPARIVLMIILVQFLMPIILLPVFVPPTLALVFEKLGWLPAPPVNVIFSLLLLGATIALYYFSLRSQAQFLEKREKDILLVVTHDAE